MIARLRNPLIAAAVLVAEFIVLASIVPSAGTGGHGAPTPILFLGAINGLVAAMAAVGIVIVYRSIRIINFAQPVIGTCAFTLIYNFLALTIVPFPIALVLGLLLSTAIGVLFDVVVMRRFAGSDRLVLTIFTIMAGAFFAAAVTATIDHLPFFPNVAQRTAGQVSHTESLAKHLPFSGFSFHLPGSAVPFGFAHVFAIVLPIALLIGLAVFLRRNRLGVAVRALAENSERASLLGINVGLLSSVVWGISGLLSGAGATISGLIGSQSGGFTPVAIVIAFAAAVIARMESLWVAAVAAVALAVLQRAMEYLQPSLANVTPVALFFVVTAGLLLQSRTPRRSEGAHQAAWEGSQDVRSVPPEMAKLGALRAARWVLLGFVVVGVLLFPFLVNVGTLLLASSIVVFSLLGLSLIPVTAWSGQVSLGQVGIAAFGAVTTGLLAAKAGLPFFLVIPAAALAGAVVAVLIGLPALRLPGLYLALATFAFSLAVGTALADHSHFGWLVTRQPVKRPTLLFLNLTDERSMYFFCVAVLVAIFVLLRNLRHSRFGRALIGVRDNAPNAQSAGLSPVRLRLLAFAVSGVVAGVAGALFVYLERGISPSTFGFGADSDVFVMAIVGGMGSLAGPVVGNVVLRMTTHWLASVPELASSIAPVLGIVLLYSEPGGLVAVAARARDSVLRIIAQRRSIVVPSLFADIDPDSLHLRLVPLATASATSGLASIARRYDLVSRHRDDRDGRDTDRERRLIEAAALGEGGDA